MEILSWIRRLFEPPDLNIEAKYLVEFDGIEVRCTCPDGDVTQVRWDNLHTVKLCNADEGPFAPVALAMWLPQRLPGHCSAYGYDLTGNVSGVCPECGTAR